MALPYFYMSELGPAVIGTELALDEETSRHIVQVLRMKAGDPLQLTDGRGTLLDATISVDHKKKCMVTVSAMHSVERETSGTTIGISLLKNTNRFEWFLEKATEIGVGSIIPLVCSRTEKHNARIDRLKTLLVSAMLQSQRAWLPELREPISFATAIPQCNQQQKFIAHCEEEDQRNLSDLINANLQSQVILIGPEGDFTREEIKLALDHKFIPVSLGASRLRSETAGVVAITLLNVK